MIGEALQGARPPLCWPSMHRVVVFEKERFRGSTSANRC